MASTAGAKEENEMIAFSRERSQAIPIWSVTRLRRLGITAKFFGRQGGSSTGAFYALNQGYGLGDEDFLVRDNRKLAYQAGGFGPWQPVLVKQIHSTKVIAVTENQSGQGWLNENQTVPEADGMITATPGLPLAVKTADCLPVMLADRQGRAVAILHAGWRGLINGIVEQGITQFNDLYGIAPQELIAVLGPAIGPKKFTVTAELFNLFRAYGSNILTIRNKLGFVSLGAVAKRILANQGIGLNHVYQLKHCTYTMEEHYFSFRRDDGQTGRQLSMIQIN